MAIGMSACVFSLSLSLALSPVPKRFLFLLKKEKRIEGKILGYFLSTHLQKLPTGIRSCHVALVLLEFHFDVACTGTSDLNK